MVHANRQLKEPRRYDNKNIIDMAEYVYHLAKEFKLASEKGASSVFWRRHLRDLEGRTRADYLPIDEVVPEISKVSKLVLSSRTKSQIADAYLKSAVHTLGTTTVKSDQSLSLLMNNFLS